MSCWLRRFPHIFKQGSVLSEQTELLVLLSSSPKTGISTSQSLWEQAGEWKSSRTLHHTFFWHGHKSLQTLRLVLYSFLLLSQECCTVYSTDIHKLWGNSSLFAPFSEGEKNQCETDWREKMFPCDLVSQGRLVFRHPCLPALCCHPETTPLPFCAGIQETVFLWASQTWNSCRLCLLQTVRSHTECRSLLNSSLPVFYFFNSIQLLKVSREDEATTK